MTEPNAPRPTPLPTRYVPAEHEDRVRARWDRAGAFHADPQRVLAGRTAPFCILIPPPNVTAALHLGHALNNSLQDMLCRAHRMMGFETLWMPGTDHAGIATQTVVEKRILAEEGKRRTDFTRDAFVARIQAFKDEYEATITDQLKRIGCSCDWQRQRFTMDEVCARAVREAFFRLFRDGLIYRGKRLVNWDPVSQTALADDEVEMEEVDGHFYYLRYPLVHAPANPADPRDAQEVTWSELAARGYPGADAHDPDDNAWVTVATTRPETYLGDTAVAVNPKDPRAVPLRGLFVQLPLVGRVIPIVEDDYVVMPDAESGDAKARYATGFLKVTPAHDPNDYEIGRRHNLPVINVMAPDASISDRHGWSDVGDAGVFVGKPREAARELVVREFHARGLLERTTPYRHAVGHSYRSHVPIEPYLSDQWYVKVTDDRLRGAALRAMAPDQRAPTPMGRVSPIGPMDPVAPPAADGSLRFHPDRYARTFQTWHEHLRDWCISRQLWWGHRIPVWHRRMTIERGDHAEAGEFGAIGLDHLVRGEYEHGVIRVHNEAGEPIDPHEVVRLDPGKSRTFDIFVCYDGSDPRDTERLEEAGFTQDPDVLDTWFSSALWPLSTMGWPDAEQAARDTGIADFPALLDAFNPTDVLCTGRDIITLWVSRMVMFNRYFLDEGAGTGRLPFRDVYIHPIIQDGHGQRMSKSLGNGVNPLDIVHSHGADALRLVLCQTATATQDVRMPVDALCPHCAHTFEPAWATTPAGHRVAAPRQTCPACSKPMVTSYGVASGHAKPTADAPLAMNSSSRFDAGRNFCNKLWNASRFALSILEQPGEHDSGEPVGRASLSLVDRWMLSRLEAAVRACEDAISGYQFAAYAQAAYDLLWRDFCDWYLEAVKPTVASSRAQRSVLAHVFEATLRLLHPVIPFVTEAIYERARDITADPLEGVTLAPTRTGGLLATAGWPILDDGLHDEAAEREFERVRSLVTAIRDVRSQHQTPPKRRVRLHAPPEVVRLVADAEPIVQTLAGLHTVTADAPDGPSVSFLFEGRDARLSDLADAVDADAERDRLSKRIADLDRSIAALEQRLANPGYSERAPPHLVQQTRDQLDRARSDRAAAADTLESLR
ncbi:MAG: valine--tRNA ligase [Phycisphaerales bacterium]|nr:valine--tRNA ligase [Phycisphaerales bacterium]